MLDSYRRKVSDDPTPARMASLLSNVDNGDVAALALLQLEMEAKDARVQAVAETRRRALTALEWRIIPEGSSPLAVQLASYCEDALRGMVSWASTLEHLSTAIGPNVAASELLYDAYAVPIATVDIPGHRLTSNPWLAPGLQLETDPGRWVEMGLFPPGKFIIHCPEKQAGFPFRRTLTHATVVPYMTKHFSRADWMAFSELYGVPWRWAECDDTVPDEDRDEIEDMLDNLSSDVRAAFRAGVQIKTLELGNRTGDTFVNQIEWADKTISVLYLGQTLTTEVADRGSFAAAKVHDNVRADLLVSDIAKEARTIREQVLAPMVRFKFPTIQRAPVPNFERVLHARRDEQAERLDIEQLKLAKEWGLPVSREEVYEKLRLRQPADEEAKL